MIISKYTIDNYTFQINTFVDISKNNVYFQIKSQAFLDNKASLLLQTYDISHRICACDYSKTLTSQEVIQQKNNFFLNIHENLTIDFTENYQQQARGRKLLARYLEKGLHSRYCL